MVGVDQQDEPTPEALVRLRAAAAGVADLDEPAGDAAEDEAGADAGFDATAHADRFAELHDALVTVLADVDRG